MFLLQKRIITIAIIYNILLAVLYEYAFVNRSIEYILFIGITVLVIYYSYKNNYPFAVFILLMGLSIQSDLLRYLLSLLNITVLLVKYEIQKNHKHTYNSLLIKLFYLLIVYLFISYIIFQRTFTDYWSFPLYLVTFLSYPLACFIFIQINFSIKDLENVRKSIMTFLLIHIITVLIVPVFSQNYLSYLSLFSSIRAFFINFGIKTFNISGFTGDIHSSNLSSSNTIGLLSYLFITYTFIIYFRTKIKKNLLVLCLAIIVFIMTDTKHAYFAVMISFLILLFLLLKKQKEVLIKYFLIILIISSSIYLFIYIDSYKKSIKTFHNEYFIRRSNPKLELYRRCLNENIKNPLLAIIGRGPGSFGSRVSNSRAADMLHKSEIKLPDFIPLTTNQDYKNVMTGLYEQSFVRRSKSGAMQNPFASFIGIVMEMGLFGSTLFISIFLLIIKYCIKSFFVEKDIYWSACLLSTISIIILILIVSIFDQYFESPALMIPFWLIIGLSLKRIEVLKSIAIVEKTI
ncbi:MAG: hypothetical protein JXA99_17120 [Candidatus Lokiarchaeota archaeon]|nr:hypothetical protein [Candidatus Lokiarchaeota archaeon]